MKRVFNNAEQTIHVWAQQTQNEGHSANVYFEDTAAIYYYGRHYPLALIATNKKGAKAAIINTSGYSSTTSKHIATASGATRHYMQFSIPSTELMKELVRAERNNKPEWAKEPLSKAIVYTIDFYNSRLRTDTVKRRAVTLDNWKSNCLSQCDSYIQLLDWYGLKMDSKARAALKAITGKSPLEAREAAQKAASIDAKKRAKLQAEKDKRDAIAIQSSIDSFLRGDTLSNVERDYLYRSKETVLRINSDEIETSKGATFPIGHGVKAFALIQTVMKAGEAWQRNGKTLHLGNFQVDRIEPTGTVIAGCHTVTYESVERIAKQLKLI